MARHLEPRHTVRDEANALVALAFRNGPIEDLHAGMESSLLGDPSLSRITDDEMKTIMLEACRSLERLLREKQDDPKAYYAQIVHARHAFCKFWER